jgi:hypothetical protein
MDNQENLNSRVTVLESIIVSVGESLFYQWSERLTEENRTEENVETIRKNAADTAMFVISTFMERFNLAAEDLKDQS